MAANTASDNMDTADQTQHIDTNTKKRTLSEANSISETPRQIHDQSVDAMVYPSDCPPEGILPMLQNVWQMLLSIKSDTASALSKAASLDDRLLILEDQNDHTGGQLSILEDRVSTLAASNQALVGRLIRAEQCIGRQQHEITDLKARSMRDNIIIRSKGATYKESRDENTDSVFQAFVGTEMRVAGAENIHVARAHRMGHAFQDNNRMIIAKVPNQGDHSKIFANASALRNTNFSISKQIPPEMEERKQFAWKAFKKAKSERRPSRFEGSRLFVDNAEVPQYQSVTLPPTSAVLHGTAVPPFPVGTSDLAEDAGHSYRAWAIPTQSLQDVRNAYDRLLQLPDFATATHCMYAFQLNGAENFHSDNDHGAGLNILRALKAKDAHNRCVFVSHNITGTPTISWKKRSACIEAAVCGALMALSVPNPTTL